MSMSSSSISSIIVPNVTPTMTMDFLRDKVQTISPLPRTSRSLQYEKHHTQFYDPMITDFRHFYYESSTTTAGHYYYNDVSGYNQSNLAGETDTGDSSLSGSGGLESDSSNDSIVIICALFVPFIIAISAILIIALLIRRMRRAESMNEIVDEEKGCSPSNSSHHLSNFYHYSQHISIEHIPELHSTGLKSTLQQHPSFVTKKSIPLPVILGLEEPKFTKEDETDSKQVKSRTEIPSSIESSSSSSSGFHKQFSTSSASSVDNVGTSSSSLNSQVNGKSSASVSSLGNRVVNVLNFPKRRKEAAAEKKRFNIYTVSLETREQLKQIYVY